MIKTKILTMIYLCILMNDNIHLSILWRLFDNYTRYIVYILFLQHLLLIFLSAIMLTVGILPDKTLLL